MKTARRLLIGLLMLMCIVLLQPKTNAADIASGDCGTGMTWYLDDDGMLVVSGQGKVENYQKGNAPWYVYRDQIKSILVGSAVKGVGNYAFYDLINVTKVTVSSNVKEIGWSTFYGCSSITEIALPEGLTDIGGSAFRECTGLKKITIPSTVTSIQAYAFSGCTGLQSVVFSESDVCELRITEYVFENCTSLKTVSMPSSIRSLGKHVFKGSDALQFNIYGNGKYLGNTANPYAALIDTVDTDITYLNIASGTRVIGCHAASYCEKLTSLSIPEGVVCLGDSVFTGCTGLISVSFPSTLLEIKEYAFSGCSGLLSLEIPGKVQRIGKAAFQNCTDLRTLIIQDGAYILSDFAFSNCKNLSFVDLPLGCKTDGTIFQNCNKICVYYAGSEQLWNDSTIVLPAGGTVTFKHIHEYSATTTKVEATCTELGYVEYTCKYNHTRRDYTPRLGHTYNGAVKTVEATCNKEGYRGVSCSACGDIRVDEVIAQLEHRYVTIPVSAATCIDGGVAKEGSRCELCGKYAVVPEWIDPLGHDYQNFVSNNDATTQMDGTKTGTCVRCGAKITVVDPGSKLEGEEIDPDKNGWFQENGKWYYYEAGVTLKNQWFRDDDGWCYLTEDGSKAVDQWVYDEDGWRYVDSNGYRVCNTWMQHELGWVYLGKDGTALKNQWKEHEDSGELYYLGEDGIAVSNCWRQDITGWRWLGEDGTITKSQWVEDKGSVYYCNSSGYRVTGNYAINGHTYPFDEDGKLTEFFVITFQDWDGAPLSSQRYKYGDTVELPENPTRAPEDGTAYEFTGWSPAVTKVTGKATYTATYKTTTVQGYTITFKTESGAVISSAVYQYGQNVQVPAAPVKAADKTYTYTFAGWSPAVTVVTGNATYTATYTATYIDYTVKFINYDGTVLSNKTYHYGQTVTLPANPTREADETYSYEFTGWTPAVTKVVGNATYTATYRAVEITEPTEPEETSIYEYQVNNGEVTITGCPGGIGDIVIPDTIEGYPVTAIGAEAFTMNGSITSITVPDSVKSIGSYAFTYCNRLNRVFIGKGTSDIADYVFEGCSSMTAIIVDSENPYYCSDSYGVLFDKAMTELKAVPGGISGTYNIPSSVTTVGLWSFVGCEKLTAITGGENVTMMEASAFLGCKALKSVEISDTVKTIAPNVFSQCESLSDVYYAGTQSQWGTVTIGTGNDCLTGATIHYGEAEPTEPSEPTEPEEEIDPSKNGWIKENGKWYFYQAGYKLTNQWKADSVGLVYLGSDGAMTTNAWVQNNEGYCYVGSDGYLVCNTWKEHPQFGWALLDANGATTKNVWKEKDGQWLYLGAEGFMATNCWQKDSSGWCWLDENGHIVYGDWVYADGNIYYCDANGYRVAGKQTIDGVSYQFDSNGVLQNVYTVRFLDHDGTVLSSRSYKYGDTVTLPADPTREADETGTYTFAGWTPAVTAVTGDATYTATYTVSYSSYTIEFVDEDGTVLSTGKYQYGDTVTVPAAPVKATDKVYSYTFIGWTPEVTTVTGNATYTATYEQTYIEYTVDFVNDDGSVIASDTYHYGDTVRVPANPRKAADNTYTYTFKGWTPKVTKVTGNVVYTATYEETYIDYTVRFVDDDGTELSSGSYHYGDTVEVPADPTKAADADYTYTFAGWSPAVTTVTGDTTYTATYFANAVGSSIVKHPEAVTANSGETVQFKVETTGAVASYRWEYRKIYKWFNTSMTGYNTDTLTVGATGARNGYDYRCVVTFADGTVVYSDAAELTVITQITDVVGPNDQTVVLGYKGQFTASAQGEGIKYQWQYQRPGSEMWIDTAMEGATKATVMIETTAARDGYKYRCQITDVTGNVVVFTEPATMRVLSIKTHPTEAFAPNGGTAKFTVETSVTDGVTYQWEYSRNGGTTWTSTTMAGYNTATLTVGANLSRNGYLYRCVITGAKNSKIVSKTAVLHVGNPVVILSQPGDVETTAASNAVFTVDATNVYTYQWYYSRNGSVWYVTTATGNQTDTLTVSAKGKNGYQYRCQITGLDGSTTVTQIAVLTVK